PAAWVPRPVGRVVSSPSDHRPPSPRRHDRAGMTALRPLRPAMHRGYVDFRSQGSPASWLGGWCVRVLAQTAFFALIGQLLGSPLKVEYLLVGNSIMVGCEAALLAVQA